MTPLAAAPSIANAHAAAPAAGSGILLQPACGAHAPGLARAHVRSWQAAYAGIVAQAFLDAMCVEERTRRWEDILQKNASQTLVALAAQPPQQVLGFVSLGPCRDAGAPTTLGELWALYADPAAWGQGVGAALAEAALHALRERGCTAASLWVLSDNLRGRRFYRRLGFEEVEGSTQRFELGGQPVDELRMTRPLCG